MTTETAAQRRDAEAGRAQAEADMASPAWIKSSDQLTSYSPAYQAAYHARYYELRPGYFPPCGCVKALTGWVRAEGCAEQHAEQPGGLRITVKPWLTTATRSGT